MFPNTRLVGRGPLLATLDAERRKAAAGSFRCALLLGDAGVGKSRLASEFVRSGGRGSVVSLLARAHPFGEPAPLEIWAEAFESHLRGLPPAEIERLAGGFLDDLAALLRSVAAVRGWAPSREPPRARLLQGLAALISNLSERSTVVVVMDDMHLADASSWEVVDYIARNLGHCRVLLVAAARPAELEQHQTAVDVLLALEQADCLQRIEVTPLQPEALGKLAETMVGGPPPLELLDWLWTKTRGNPLFALLLLRALTDENADLRAPGLQSLPEGLSVRVRRNLRPLDEPTATTLEIMAILGKRIDIGELMQVTGQSLEGLGDILRTLVRARLVQDEERGTELTYEIAHPLVEETIYESMGSGRRRALHRLVGRALLAAGRLGAAACHLARSADSGDPEAVEALRDALRRSEQRGAGQETLEILHALVQLLPDEDPRWLDIFNVLTWQAEEMVAHHTDAHAILGVGAMRQFDRMLASSSDPGPRAAVKFRLAHFLTWGTGDLEEAETVCRSARDLFEQAGDRRSMLHADNELTWITMLQGELDKAEDAARGVVDAARTAGEILPMAHALGMLGYHALVCGRFGKAEAISQQAIDVAREQGDDFWLVANLSALALVHAFAGCPGQSLPLLEEARRASATHGQRMLLESSSVVAWFAGNFAASVTSAIEALACNSGIPGRWRGWALPFSAVAAAENGSLVDGQRCLNEARATYRTGTFQFLGSYCSWAEAVLLSHQGKVGDAMDVLSGAVRPVVDMGAWPTAALLLHDLAEMAAAANEARRAADAAAQLGRAATMIDCPLYHGLAAAARGWAELADGDAESAARSARDAVALLSAGTTKALLGRALALLGRSLASSDRVEAVEAFGHAVALFAECGADRRREQAIEAMRGLGSRGRRAAACARGPESLTARERQVLQLAAQGYTCKQISEELFISQRTTETHLSNAYAKLGVDSRAQLLRQVSDLKL
jgi:DNA-binding NarL/FixJ family response regulator